MGRPNFDFRALTYFPERPDNLMAYLTLFPVGSQMRANYFVYRDMRDPWFQQMRAMPAETIAAALPGLKAITGEFEIPSPVDIRPVDLYAVSGHKRSGVVLVGDAFSTSCPAAGSGVSKVFTDVERLCNVYIPRWLATPGMDAKKISAFYDDPVKRACDADSRAQAFFLRSLSTDQGALWRARRWLRFVGHFGRGLLRGVRERGPLAPQRLQPAIPR
jgi:2-polyprenyl-6-methoxyphenol hydroxylase-like FAD-dependent oxidoreductase